MTLEDTLFNQFNAFQVGNSSKAIIWNYDIFGLDGGRTKQMADFMADHGDDNNFLFNYAGVTDRNAHWSFNNFSHLYCCCHFRVCNNIFN